MMTMSFDTDTSRWNAVTARDARAEGAFLYAVRTTGVYCRPTCHSRLPRRENVAFFDAPAAAEGAGFRACKRCAPNVTGAAPAEAAAAEAVARACRLIEASAEPPSLEELAAAVSLSRFHFHRLFKQATGVTPKQYATAHRLRRLRDGLQGGVRSGASVTDAIYDAGFGASSRAYAAAPEALGMTPGTLRDGAASVVIHYAVGQCSLGWAIVAATERGVCAIELGDSPDDLLARLRARFPKAHLSAGDAAFAGTVRQVVALLETPERGLNLPLDIQGTAFQRRVWDALRQIPSGRTASYASIAARIGQPSATRVVAQACAANTLAVAIPCHRVVRGDGELGGYRWGVTRKRVLLEREAAASAAPTAATR